MKSTLFSSIGVISMGLLLILPSESSLIPSASRPSTDSAEFLITQCRAGRTGRARGPEDALIPYVISPRNTAILSDRPQLRWNAVPGVDRYTVSLMNGDTIVWTKEVQTNQIAYPEEVEPLQPGINYTLAVKAANGRTSMEEDTELSFYLLSADQAAIVRQAPVLSEPSAPETAALLQANLYAGSELYGEAIATLEMLLDQGKESAIVYRQLGDWYEQSGLYLRAESNYLKALPLAEDNLEAQARIQATLGELYEVIEQNQEAVRYLTQAQESYEQLNNQLKIKEMQEQIDSLSSS